MATEPIRIGLVINPIAGMGGSVGLKGTDFVLQEALTRGAVPRANERAAQALERLLPLQNQLEIYCFSGEMGQRVCEQLGFRHQVLGEPSSPPDSGDTRRLAKLLLDLQVKLILFAGGDGTACDLYAAVGDKAATIGIPAGVKIHSPVYAKRPADAGELALRFLTQGLPIQKTEVLDLDERQYRHGVLSTRLCGYLSIPTERTLLQNRKAPTPLSEQAAISSIAHQMVDEMLPDVYYLIGAGTTTAGIMELLGLPNTLIGVDLIQNRTLVAADLYGDQILQRIKDKPTRMILTVTGGQGFLFGRGNQQITPAVIRVVGRENISIVATQQKIFSLRGQPLLTDTGDPALDLALSGYWQVTTAYKEKILCEVR